ncbi:DNA-3-methyladenine glycosylase family protein [Virgibacillus oceani]|uniref:DNA-3-methyladenine glycosylase II n=1 Tax=Virgibacillus oceani TaxID=1479511 RepID=A0A917H950_9BACI|nr:DNA-3-methyladenine glycosylase 2 family protein [Virgibacillus oceani]GGG70740.1 DNA-3-methyladenine glycosylase [Virgibacillus oceani]
MEKLIIKKDDKAVRELCKADPAMKKLTAIVGDIEVLLRPNYFISLVRSIIGQLISVQAADAIYRRLEILLNYDISPETIEKVSDEQLRAIGLSSRKVSYIRDFSQKVLQSEINLQSLNQLDNKQIINQLTSIKGIGKWTVEMFLIFSLGRMDVLASVDIGIQRGARWLYQVDKSERRSILEEKSKLWNPHFTIASFYLWEVVQLNFVSLYKSLEDLAADQNK